MSTISIRNEFLKVKNIVFLLVWLFVSLCFTKDLIAMYLLLKIIKNSSIH